MKSILFFTFFIFYSFLNFAQIQILTDRPFWATDPIYNPNCLAPNTISSIKAFSIGPNESENLNFIAAGTNNVGIGTRTRASGFAGSNSPNFYLCLPYYYNEGKLHIRHFGTENASTIGSGSPIVPAPLTNGPQLVLEQATNGQPSDDYFSRIKFRSSTNQHIGNNNYYKTSFYYWQIKASNYVAATGYAPPSPDTEEFAIEHALNGQAFHIYGNLDIRHSEFTQLGTYAPKIKMSVVTAFIPGSPGQVAYSHGIANPANILSISMFADIGNNEFVPPSNTILSGTLYNYRLSGAFIILITDIGTSTVVAGKTVKILITYTE